MTMANKTVGKYVLHETLGEGSFGKVKRAVNSVTNEAVAIKILDKVRPALAPLAPTPPSVPSHLATTPSQRPPNTLSTPSHRAV